MTATPPPLPIDQAPQTPTARVARLTLTQWLGVLCAGVAAYFYWITSNLGAQGAARNLPFTLIFGTLAVGFICGSLIVFHLVLQLLLRSPKLILALELLAIITLIGGDLIYHRRPTAQEIFYFYSGHGLPLGAKVNNWGAIRGLNEGQMFFDLELDHQSLLQIMTAKGKATDERAQLSADDATLARFEERGKQLGLDRPLRPPAEWFSISRDQRGLRLTIDGIWQPAQQRAVIFIRWS